MSDEPVSELRQSYEKHGYVIARSVLTDSEIRELRTDANEVLDRLGVSKGGGRVLPNAAVMAPQLSRLFTDPRLLSLAREVLGVDELLFTYEADVHRNFLSSSWHKDTGETQMDGGYFGLASFGRDDCRLVKLGIYLQDHTIGGGLQVVPSSHRKSSMSSAGALECAVKSGDVVLFDVRITHRGAQAGLADRAIQVMTRPLPSLRRANAVDALRRSLLAKLRREDRLAIFFAFGLVHENTETFARRNMRRQMDDLRAEAISLPDSLTTAYRNEGVKLASLVGP